MANNVYVESVLALLESQVGYHEKASNANLKDFDYNAGSGNFTKFAKELDDIHYWNLGNSNKNGYEWCAAFCNWIIWMCSGKDVDKTKEVLCIPKNEENLAAGVEFLRTYFRAVGRYDAKPQVGDLVLFHTTGGSNAAGASVDHVGMAIRISDTELETIEGNSQNMVRHVIYSRSDGNIMGYCHPRYDNASETADYVQQIADLTNQINTLTSKNTKLINQNDILNNQLVSASIVYDKLKKL